MLPFALILLLFPYICELLVQVSHLARQICDVRLFRLFVYSGFPDALDGLKVSGVNNIKEKRCLRNVEMHPYTRCTEPPSRVV